MRPDEDVIHVDLHDLQAVREPWFPKFLRALRDLWEKTKPVPDEECAGCVEWREKADALAEQLRAEEEAHENTRWQ